MSPRRRDALLLALAATAFVSGLAARPVVRVLDPELAVDAFGWVPVDDKRHGRLVVTPAPVDPWDRTFGRSREHPFGYSYGPDGVDDLGGADDVSLWPPRERRPIFYVVEAIDGLGVAIALTLLWITATFHATTFARRLGAGVLLTVLLAVGASHAGEHRLVTRLPIDSRNLLISPDCALFLTLGFAGTLWLAWASRRAPVGA